VTLHIISSLLLPYYLLQMQAHFHFTLVATERAAYACLPRRQPPTAKKTHSFSVFSALHLTPSNCQISLDALCHLICSNRTVTFRIKDKLMGNSMSHHGAGSGPTYYEHDNGQFALEPYDPKSPCLRGRDIPQHSNGGAYQNGGRAERSATRDGAGHGRLSPQCAEETPESDFCEVPAQDFYAATRGLRRSRRLQNKVSGRGAPVSDYFDFNDSQQPNPWRLSSVQREPEFVREPQREREPRPEPEVNFTFVCWWRC
jgi:hypothetical protein